MRTAAQTAFFMAILTLISKLLGFIREMVLAGFYGTSYVTDAYVLATNIPNMIFAGIFAAIATAYMPLLSDKIEKSGQQEANRFTSQIINIMLVVSAISSLLGILFSDQIVMIFASGFEGETAQLTSWFIKVTFSYAFFTSTSGILQTYLQYRNVFLSPIVAGYFQNFIIIGIILFSAAYGHIYLAFGLLIGNAVRALIIYLVSKKHQYKYTFDFQLNEPIRHVFALALPTFIGGSVSQINNFVDKTLATGLAEGSASALNYANLLILLVTGLTASIFATILYPKLTQASVLKDNQRFGEIVGSGIHLIGMVGIPFTLGAMVYSEQVVQIIYERGAFDPAATSLTSSAFFYYGVGLFFVALVPFIGQMYYSRKNMKTPMLIGLVSIVIGVVLNLILVQYMAHDGLALATSIATACNACFLYIGFKRFYPDIPMFASGKKLFKILFASIVAVGVSYLFYYFVGNAIFLPRMVLLGLTVILAALLYLALLILFKIEEVKYIKQILR